MRWFEQHLPAQSVHIENVSKSRIGFQIAGPNSRELLQRVTRVPMFRIRRFRFYRCVKWISANARQSYNALATPAIGVTRFMCRPIIRLRLYQVLSEAGRDLEPATLRYAGDDEPAPGQILRLLDARIQARLHADGDRARPFYRL